MIKKFLLQTIPMSRLHIFLDSLSKKFPTNIIKLRELCITIILLLIFTQSAFALTAESSSYLVSKFDSGLQASKPSSDNYQLSAISTNQGGTRNSAGDTFTANTGFFGNTTYYVTVSITSYSISPSSAVIGSTIGLYISALNAQSVWAKITSPNAQEQTLTLTNNQFVNYLPSPSVVGRYDVIFYANSSSGAIASAVNHFELTAQTSLPAQSSSSGGGNNGGVGSSTTIIEKCTYIWDCTPWNLCSEGKQKRVCANIGSCAGTEGKPIEERVCSDALFDVVMKFKEIELTKNETLKFGIDLTETKGIEKIDVQIKYSIIDSKNNEIFSQIETRAIQGNLTYQKEINEIKLTDGGYTLRIDILYGNLQRAFAEQKFEVKDKGISVTNYSQNNLIFYFISIATGMASYLTNIPFYIKTHITSYATFANNKINFPDYIKIMIIIIIVILAAIFVFIRIYPKISKYLKTVYSINSKEKEGYGLTSTIGKKVYTETGDEIGKVIEVYCEDKNISGWLIKLDSKFSRREHHNKFMIRHKDVLSVKDIMIIRGDSISLLTKLKKN